MPQLQTKNSKLRTIFVVGPTASGKTALAIDLARLIGAEVICADSQTVRKDMNIGTAKPTDQEMQGIEHHMLDQINPYKEYSLAIFHATARGIMAEIHAKGKPVIVVGGTGLYVDSLYFNYTLPTIPADTLLSRTSFEDKSIEQLSEYIIEQGLSMPKNAVNKRHLINVILRDGHSGKIGLPSPGSVIIGLNPGREVIIKRIDSRVEKMFTVGFVQEVRSILNKYGKPPKTFDAIGYKIVMRMIGGAISEPEAKELFKIADRQYAKRQMSWLKRNPNIKWFKSPKVAKDYIIELCQK